MADNRQEDNEVGDEEYRTKVAQLLAAAKSYADNTGVDEERATTLRYYKSRPYGDEREDMSSFVTAEVLECVTWLLPGIKRKFLMSAKAVEFESTHDTDGAPVPTDQMQDFLRGKVSNKLAEDATHYVNHVFYVENDGYIVLEGVLWDAMVSKTGIMKHYWHEERQQTTQRFFELTPEQLDGLVSAELPDGIDIDHEVDREYEGPDGEALVDVSVTRTMLVEGTAYESVAPEDFLVLPGDDYVHEGMRGCFERIRKPRHQLIDEGYDEDLVMRIPAGTVGDEEEATIVRENTSTNMGASSADKMQADVIIWQCHVNIDRDGDGTTELRRVMLGGNDGGILMEDEPSSEIPYTDFCGLRVPHTFYGDCPADRVADLQRLASEAMRQALDYGVEVNTPTLLLGSGAEREDGSTIRDVSDRVAGDTIRVDDVTQARWDRPPDMSPLNQWVLSWVQNKTMERTGASPVQPASDPNSLQPGSATEVVDRRQAFDELKDDMAASFANSLRRVFRQTLRLEVNHANKPKRIKVGDTFRTIDPRVLPNDLDVKTNVALGNATQQLKMAQLTAIRDTQAQLIGEFGFADDNPGQGFVTRNQLFNTCRNMVQASALDDPDQYYSDPTGKGGPQIPPEILQQIEAEAMQKATQSALIQLEKYKVDKETAARIEAAMIQAQQRDTESERETIQKERDSQRDAQTKIYEINAETRTERQKAAADVFTSRFNGRGGG